MAEIRGYLQAGSGTVAGLISQLNEWVLDELYPGPSQVLTAPVIYPDSDSLERAPRDFEHHSGIGMDKLPSSAANVQAPVIRVEYCTHAKRSLISMARIVIVDREPLVLKCCKGGVDYCKP